MAFDPNIHRRRSIRLQGYDYSKSGAYFVTICAQNRACLFGEIVDGNMRLNDAGQMIEQWYFELENKFPDIQCSDFICMPNHIHFIVVNVGADLRVCPDKQSEHATVGADLCVCPPDKQGEHATVRADLRVCPSNKQGEHVGSPLHKIVQWFKTMTTNAYIHGVKQHHWQPFNKKLWQRNYYEHIVRNNENLQRIQQYIKNNPSLWQQDVLHPDTQERIK